MRTFPALVLVITVALSCTAAGQPVITAISGQAIEDSLVTILGDAFGVKDPAPPLRWDDFKEGSPGDPLSGWQISSTYPDKRPRYSSDKERVPGDLTAFQDFSEGNYNCAIMLYPLPDFQQLYVTGWWYNEVGGAPSRNFKLMNLTGGSSPSNVTLPQARCDMYPKYPSGHLYTVTVDGEQCDDWSLGGNLHSGEWMRIERFIDVGTINGNDGISMVMRNLQLWARVDCTLYSDTTPFNILTISHYFAQDEGTPRPWMKSYWDELYVDTTLARVEIGDAPRWSDCTHREIQIPVTWSPTAITVTFHQGTFVAGEQVYLFVVDEDGNPSPEGYPLLIGQSDDDPGPPGPPGKPTHG